MHLLYSTVRSCFATLKMQACSAETSAWRNNRIDTASNLCDYVPVQLIKGANFYTAASTVSVTGRRSKRLNTAICKWSRPVPALAFYITRLSTSPDSYAGRSDPHGLWRSPCMIQSCSSLLSTYFQALALSSGQESVYASETLIFTEQTSRCQNINLMCR